HPGERTVTRRILNNAADRQFDPWIGRRLPGLFSGQGFADVTVETFVTTDEGGGVLAWLDYALVRAALADSAGVDDREEAVRRLAALGEGFRTDDFFFGYTQFAVLGRIPV